MKHSDTRGMHTNEAYRFERTNPLHETRMTEGIVNRMTPLRWRNYHDDKVNRKSKELVETLVRDFDRSVIVAIGAGGGGLLRFTWKEPGITRIGLDINHEVLVRKGKQYFKAVEGSAFPLPIRDDSADIVLFDYVLHHLLGQDVMERSIREAVRILRPRGYIIAREPSSFSPSGMALNVANRFRLLNALTGSSNYEFAISPMYLCRLFEREGFVVSAHGLTYLWSRRLPIWAQDAISRLEPYVFRTEQSHWLADFLLYIFRRSPPETARPTASSS